MSWRQNVLSGYCIGEALPLLLGRALIQHVSNTLADRTRAPYCRCIARTTEQAPFVQMLWPARKGENAVAIKVPRLLVS